MTTRRGRKCTLAFRRDRNGLIWPHDAWPDHQADIERVTYDDGTGEWCENGYFLTPADYDAAIREAEERAWEAARASSIYVYNDGPGGVSGYENLRSMETPKFSSINDWRKSRGEK